LNTIQQVILSNSFQPFIAWPAPNRNFVSPFNNIDKPLLALE
jgi:hypothetical protein